MKINLLRIFGPVLIMMAIPVLATSNEFSDLNRHATPTHQLVSVPCNTQQAFQQGAAGNSYPDTCPRTANKDLLFAYQSGQHVFELRNDLQDLEQSLAIRQRDLRSLQSATYELEATLMSTPPPPDQRLRTLLQLHKLGQQKSDVEAEISWLEFERDYRQTLRSNLELSYTES